MTFTVPTTSIACQTPLWFHPYPSELECCFSVTSASVNPENKDLSSRFGEACAVNQPDWFEPQFCHLPAV